MNNAQIEALINGLQFSDPRIAEALRLLNKEAAKATAEMDKRLRVIEGPKPLPVEGPPADVVNFKAEARQFSIHFTWDRTTIEQRAFEIRVGATWDTAQRVLTTSSLTFDIDPTLTGTYTYLIKAISTFGVFSLNATSTVLVIAGPGGVTVTSGVIDNNVLLSWNPSLSAFQIDYYLVKRGPTEVGRQASTFFVIFEGISGTYTYSIIPFDIAGNAGPASNRDVIVSQPTDYEVKDIRISDLTGTRVNVARFAPSDSYVRLIFNVHGTETWRQHFEANGFTTPRDQINAGYPFYCQPNQVNGSYEEIYDYGITFTNVLITLNWNKTVITGTVAATLSISYSSNGTVYSTPEATSVVYAVSMRYLKLRVDSVASA